MTEQTDPTSHTPEIAYAPEASRWEARLGGRLAGFADVREAGGVATFPHTLVEPEFEGRGVASALARASLDDARARGLTVRPACSFYARWIERHPDYADLVAGA